MPWFRVDDGFHGHPKVADLSLEAVGLWALAGSWCAQYLTDGFVSERTLRRLGGSAELGGELASAGLWDLNEGGWQFKDWTDYQPSKAEVEAERDAARERMKKVRAAKKGARGSSEVQANNTRTFGRSSEEVRSAPPSPTLPTLVTSKEVTPSRIDDAFESAYGSWPKKVEKKKSLAKFRLLAKNMPVETLVSHIQRFGKAYRDTTDKQYVPSLVAWLNGERWNDDPPTASTDTINQQWDAAMSEHKPDPCANGHRWVADGSCARCLVTRDNDF